MACQIISCVIHTAVKIQNCEHKMLYVHLLNTKLLDIFLLQFFVILLFKRLKGFFPDCTSFNLAIDLLFTKGQFEGKS